MAKNNKPRIPINSKPIDELDTDTRKEIVINSDKESFEEGNPFSSSSEEDKTPTLFEEDTLEDFDTTENPFLENDEDFDDDNPFDTNDQTYNEDYDDIASTIEPPPISTTPKMDLEIDPKMPYFFVFGNSTAGKSAMLSGLLYYMQTAMIGQLRSLSLNNKEHHRKGDFVLNEMTKKVRNGKFISGTQTLDATEFVLPTEINLEFEPYGKPSMPFCLLEMAGEDLREIELRDEGKTGGNFDERINAYLQHPECNMIFICVVDVDTPENSEDLISEFLRYVHKAGHTDNPVLITVNKWDKIASQENSVEDYIKDKLHILHNNLFDENRDIAYMKFSIGDVVSDSEKGDTYNFKSEDSEKLLEWMYETATGQSLNEDIKTSALSKIFKSIKNIFSNE